MVTKIVKFIFKIFAVISILLGFLFGYWSLITILDKQYFVFLMCVIYSGIFLTLGFFTIFRFSYLILNLWIILFLFLATMIWVTYLEHRIENSYSMKADLSTLFVLACILVYFLVVMIFRRYRIKEKLSVK